MTTHYQHVQDMLRKSPKTWLITGVAGFIGSNLLEALLRLDQRVVGLDNFSTGRQRNLDDVQAHVEAGQWARFHVVDADIRMFDNCIKAMRWPPTQVSGDGAAVDIVLHQAALGSVPRSLEDPLLTNENNITGFLNMLVAARDAGVKRFVYAASSSTYGDHPGSPKVEERIGNPLSPYAVTKYVNELYAHVFATCHDYKTIGLRYFNIFGRRQDPEGAYAAVIPKWMAAMITNQTVYINGDGETSRDFCYIENAIQANILAAVSDNPEALDQVYNIAVGESTSLNSLYAMLRNGLVNRFPHLVGASPVYRDFRPGDVRHSLADISKAVKLLDYQPSYGVNKGLEETMDWFVRSWEASAEGG